MLLTTIYEIKSVLEDRRHSDGYRYPHTRDIVVEFITSIVLCAIVCSFLALAVSAILSCINIGAEKDYSKRIDNLSSIVCIDDVYYILYIEDASDTIELQSVSCKNVKVVKSDESEICVYKGKRFPLDLLYSFNSKLLSGNTSPEVVVYLEPEHYNALIEDESYYMISK